MSNFSLPNTPYEFGLPKFSEESVIGNLLNSSKEFYEFYQSERRKITNILIWVKDDTLPKGIDYRVTRFSTGENFIKLRYIPAVIEDACKIAHEIEHFVLDAEGFPVISSLPQYENLASATSSMVLDLIVNTRLIKFGFNLREDYDKEIAETKSQLERIHVEPDNRIEKMHWMVNYVSHLLDWELVNTNNIVSEFQVWFETKYPNIASRGMKLFAMVKRIGYDSPEKQTRLFREIIRRYTLEGILVL